MFRLYSQFCLHLFGACSQFVGDGSFDMIYIDLYPHSRLKILTCIVRYIKITQETTYELLFLAVNQ